MKSLSSLGLGLSLVFGCLLLALIAELYYLLWWKKKISKSERRNGRGGGEEIDNNSKIHEPPQQEVNFHGGGGDSNKDFWYKKPFGEDGHGDGDGDEEEEDDDDELMLKLQNMAGPTRFLFTIKEETKEDMAESEDGKSRNSRKGSRSRSLSDLFHIIEMEKTPYLTPMASPPYFTPPLTPVRTNTSSYYFGSSVSEAYEAEFFNSWLRSSSSSSPNFQFLKNAEKKLHNRKLELDLDPDLEIEIDKNGVSIFDKNEEENDKNRQEHIHHFHHHQHSPNTYRVLPLSSSPSSLV